MTKQNVIEFQLKDPKARAKCHLSLNNEKVLEQITVMHLCQKDLTNWKGFAMEISVTLKQAYDQMKDDMELEQRNFFGLALVVFSTLTQYLNDWEKTDPEVDMVYPLNYLDFFYITSYLNAGSEAYPHYHNFAHKYLDQVLPTMAHDFEYTVELAMEYSRNLPLYTVLREATI
ncbi:hypothetical protein EMIT07CA2_550006 [Brevibacillus sp. IT-7CA2]|uniref:hypothetical protein n=1 Tax=Brevibacillus sp. IT-7CA2 TaxID=3026436 RepID=UPI0039E05A84